MLYLNTLLYGIAGPGVGKGRQIAATIFNYFCRNKTKVGTLVLHMFSSTWHCSSSKNNNGPDDLSPACQKHSPALERNKTAAYETSTGSTQ